MEKMYQPFSRQTDSRVNSIQGTGLGLAITKQMVELMDGTIDCRSAVGEGTTFTVSIDIAVAQRQREDMKLEPMDVLVVDDDDILLDTAMDTLRSLGVTPERAGDGQEALDMIARRHQHGRDYSVVIIDWKMPGMDGVETVRRIRAEVDAHIPILLVSAYDRSDIEDAARAAARTDLSASPCFARRSMTSSMSYLAVKRSAILRTTRLTLRGCGSSLRKITTSTGRLFPCCSGCRELKLNAQKTVRWRWSGCRVPLTARTRLYSWMCRCP
jgi:CheY-like chemotaxis protein